MMHHSRGHPSEGVGIATIQINSAARSITGGGKPYPAIFFSFSLKSKDFLQESSGSLRICRTHRNSEKRSDMMSITV